jgi:hypothetical protein
MSARSYLSFLECRDAPESGVIDKRSGQSPQTLNMIPGFQVQETGMRQMPRIRHPETAGLQDKALERQEPPLIL